MMRIRLGLEAESVYSLIARCGSWLARTRWCVCEIRRVSPDSDLCLVSHA
jgi:hypothetical protein